ncbi:MULTISPECIES: thioesterase family protein [Rhodomicrobium]|uniref:thioesterase family protein n=1 Tax=Rhodomicrobium TaxID=1068 RepID=UPI000B4B9D1A|nr:MULTISPECIES: thioesterase family protein [Rhodomicrobium]
MKSTLQPGIKARYSYVVPVEKTVPHLFSDSPEMQDMPAVFATGFMVALMELTCMHALAPHLDEGEGSVGVHVDVSHDAATPAGFTVTVEAEVTEVDGRRVWFQVMAHDGVEMIGEGYHARFIVNRDKFDAKIAEKQAKAAG